MVPPDCAMTLLLLSCFTDVSSSRVKDIHISEVNADSIRKEATHEYNKIRIAENTGLTFSIQFTMEEYLLKVPNSFHEREF